MHGERCRKGGGTPNGACALADLGGRGALDIIYNNYDRPPTIIRNNTTEGHRVIIKLAGRAPNLDAIGAELRIETASGIQVRQIYTERGVVASEPATVHFGLGKDTVISRLTIHWPNGQVQVLEDLPVDKLLTIRQPTLPRARFPAARRRGSTIPPIRRRFSTRARMRAASTLSMRRSRRDGISAGNASCRGASG